MQLPICSEPTIDYLPLIFRSGEYVLQLRAMRWAISSLSFQAWPIHVVFFWDVCVGYSKVREVQGCFISYMTGLQTCRCAPTTRMDGPL